MARYDITEELIADKIVEHWALITAHWDEVALNKEVMVLKPDLERYAALEAQGLLASLVVRTEAGDIIGYSVNAISQNLHYQDLTVCQNDVLFVHPYHRNSSVGVRLIKATEAMAKEKGAQMMLWHAKDGTPLDALLPFMNYGIQDIIYSKVLK